MNPENIFILKTNISTEARKGSARNVLDGISGIERWSIDLHDIDCVLRIVSPTLSYESIIMLMNTHGFECSELK